MQKPSKSEPPLLDPKVVERLSSKKEAERKAAEQKLQELGPTAKDALQKIVADEAKKFKKARMIRDGIVGLMALSLTLLIVTIIRNSLKVGHFQWNADLSSFFGCFGGLGCMAAATNTHKNALSKLAEFEDVSNVGAFADALGMGDRNMHTVAEKALLNLIPQMRASDWQQLSDQQRGNLHRLLYRGSFGLNDELAVRLLNALQQIGDEKDLPVVQRVSAMSARTAGQKRVHEAALNCLPFLQQNVETARSSQQLLRASSAYSTPPETLLRPANGGTVSDPAQLLRPTTVAAETEVPLPVVKTETSAESEPLQQIGFLSQ